MALKQAEADPFHLSQGGDLDDGQPVKLLHY